VRAPSGQTCGSPAGARAGAGPEHADVPSRLAAKPRHRPPLGPVPPCRPTRLWVACWAP